MLKPNYLIIVEQLIQEIKALEAQLSNLRSQLHSMSDGYIYLTCLRCYGSLSWETHNNAYSVQELCNEYYGDNGIVDVYTTNPHHTIQSYGDVNVMTLDEMKNISQDNISMSRAITNWICRGI